MKTLRRKLILGLSVFLLAGVPSSLAVGGGRRSLAALNDSQQRILNDLPADDQRNFEMMRNKFCESKRLQDFAGSFRILEGFIERRTEKKHSRAILVGYFPTLDGVFVVNQGHLKNIFSICRSTLNMKFASMGINRSLYRIGELNCDRLSMVRPMLDKRQWVVRIPKRLELVPRMISSVAVRSWQNIESLRYDAEKSEEDRIDDLQCIIDYEVSRFANMNVRDDYHSIESEIDAKGIGLNVQKINTNYAPLDGPSIEPLPIY